MWKIPILKAQWKIYTCMRMMENSWILLSWRNNSKKIRIISFSEMSKFHFLWEPTPHSLGTTTWFKTKFKSIIQEKSSIGLIQIICTKSSKIVFSAENIFTIIINIHKTDIQMKKNRLIFLELKIGHFKIHTAMPSCAFRWLKHLLEQSFNYVFPSSSYHSWDWFSFFTVNQHRGIRFVGKKLVLRLWLWQLILVSSMPCEQLYRRLLPGVSFKWQFASLLQHHCCQLSNLSMLEITILQRILS